VRKEQRLVKWSVTWNLAQPASVPLGVTSRRLQSPAAVATLASMSDHDREREGGGLAVLVLAGFLVLLLLVGASAVAWIFVRQAEQARMEAVRQMELAAYAAQTARATQAAAQAKASQPAIETPAPSAPESPPPTQ